MAASGPAPAPLFDIVGTPVCVLTNLLTGFAVLWSPYGVVLFSDDAVGPMSVVAPVLAGLVLGLLQSTAFGPRVALVAVLLPLVPLALSVVFAFSAAAQAVGIGAACAITSGLDRREGGHRGGFG